MTLILPPSMKPMIEAQVVTIVQQEANLPNGKKYYAQVPLFTGYQIPHGYLSPEPEAHALFMYNLMARSVWEREVQNPIVYEGSDTHYHGPDFRLMLERIACWYNTLPERMVRYWPAIIKQCEAKDVPMVPDEERYRFSKPGKARTH